MKRTVSKPDEVYGCNTCHPDWKPRADGRMIQDGWQVVNIMDRASGHMVETRVPKMVWCPNRMSTECDYDRWKIDKYCAGCKRANGGNNS